MAKGLLEGTLGGEEEKPEVEPPDALAGVEAFAAAIAAKLAGNDPEVARDTSAFLKKQAQLLEIQAAHLTDEHEARLHFLRGQAREVDIRRFGLRLRVGFQLFLVLVATVVGIGVVLVLHDAFTSHGVIVEPFDVPTALASHGLTGKVVASGVLDELIQLQSATRSAVAKRDLSNAWASEVALAVPEASVSVTEISRLLRNRFGNDVHIDGDLVGPPTGDLSLTIRGNGVPPKTFTGSATELGALSKRAAEYVYATAQPLL